MCSEIVYCVTLVCIFVEFVNFLPVFDIYHYYHSCLVSEFLPDLIGEYKEFFTELFHSVFSYFVVPFFNTLGGTIT